MVHPVWWKLKGCAALLVLLLVAMHQTEGSDKNKNRQQPTRLSKVDRAKDFAVGLIDVGKLQHGLSNDGAIGTLWGWNSEIYLGLGSWYKGYGYIADLSMMVGVPEGPWTPKFKNPTGNDSLSMGPSVSERFVASDWGPRAGSYGHLHSGLVNAKQIVSRGSPPAYPVMATSTIPDTWPEGYYDTTGAWHGTPGERHWPGPWAVNPGPDGIARTADDSVMVGQFTGDKEIFFSMNDFDLNDQGLQYAAAGGGNQGYPLDIQMDIHGIGYGRSFAEDFIFFPMKIQYHGQDTLKGVYLGFYLDVDAPEYNASGTINHREDWMAFIRSMYEPTIGSTVNYNMAFIYDQQSGGIGPYTAGPGPIAYTSVKLLETPKATENIDLDGDGITDITAGSQLGITDWHWFRWENRPGVIETKWREWEQYKLMSGGSKATLWDQATQTWGDFKVSQGKYFTADTMSDGRISQLESIHLAPDAWFHADAAGKLNPHFDDFSAFGVTLFDVDCVFIMSSGPFTLAPGASTTFSFALIMGDNLNDLKLNARTAQTMYDLNYLGADPPSPPTVTAVPGDGRVTLYWTDASESSKDILTRYKDFEGYKIYRTTQQPTNNQWGDAITDGQGTVVGFKPIAQYDLSNSISGLDPVYPHLDRGSNSGLVHMYIDSTVENGKTYWYSITAYDRGISSQNDSTLNPDHWADLNYLESAKGNNPGQTPNLVEVVPGRSPLGYIPPHVAAIVPNLDSLGKGTITPMVINPALANQTHTYTIVFDTASTGKLLYSLSDEINTPLVIASSQTGGSDAGPVFNGVRLIIREKTATASRDGRWTKVSSDTSTFAFGNLTAAGHPVPSDYVAQFYDKGVSSVIGVKVYNITVDPQRTTPLVDASIRNTQDSANFTFTLQETVNGVPLQPTWLFKLAAGPRYALLDTIVVGRDTTIRYVTTPPRLPSIGDEYTLRTYKPFKAGDTFQFVVGQASQASKFAAQDLQRIRVVPNPYMVTAEWELTPTQKRLAFTNLPPTCTIDIFTVTGELVKRLDRHDSGNGWEWWNLLNSSNRMVAYGLYVYVVTVPDGTKTIGKFAVIR
jgi:hypothetical protein